MSRNEKKFYNQNVFFENDKHFVLCLPPPEKPIHHNAKRHVWLKKLLTPFDHAFSFLVKRAMFGDIHRLQQAILHIQQHSPLTDEIRMETLLYEMENANIVRPNILSVEETFSAILHSEQSLARFGDGEIMLMANYFSGLPFQEYTPHLAENLRRLLRHPPHDFLIGIPHCYYYPFLYANRIVNNFSHNKLFNALSVPLWRHYLNQWINLKTVYADAAITALNLQQCAALREWLKNKKVVLTLCQQAHQNYQFHLFDSAKQLDYCFVPNKNAFQEYESVLQHLTHFPKDSLHILMAGPAAKIWAKDLHLNGFRALDLGHLAKHYDYQMQNKEMDAAFWQVDE